MKIVDLFASSVELELKTFDGEDTGIKVKLVGQDSKQFKDAQKKLLPFVGKSRADLTADQILELEKLESEITISLITGWDNDEAFGGKYSPEYALEIFSKPEAKHLVEQIGKCVLDRANFFRTNKE